MPAIRVFSNPPFNLKFDYKLSQEYYMDKAYDVLNPAGILMIKYRSVVPDSIAGGRISRYARQDRGIVPRKRPCRLCRYYPEQRFDIVIGNPPFNLKFDYKLSQEYYMDKAYDVLKRRNYCLCRLSVSFPRIRSA